MLANLAALALSAKSAAISGALILAGGAVVSASAGAGFNGNVERSEPTPIVEVAAPTEAPLDEIDVSVPSEDEESTTQEIVLTEADCQNEEAARAEAREQVESAYREYDSGLDALRAELGGKGSSAVYESLDSAKALLGEIRASAVEALDEVGLCVVTADSIDETGFDAQSGAAALMEIAGSALNAMETVYNLAHSTVLQELERLKPTPTPKPKPTAKPKPTPNEWERKKQEEKQREKERWARCDEAMYAAKSRLSKAFETYHGASDKLIWELKKWADDRTIAALRQNDELLHRAYDQTKGRIVDDRCGTGEDSPMARAERAEIFFRQTYEASKGFAQAASAHKPNRQLCEEQMHAAKKVLHANFERYHTPNDKLVHYAKSLGSQDLVEETLEADETLHETYDRTKEKIWEAPCGPNGSNAMQLAAEAAVKFERAHNEARRAVAEELADSGGDDD